MRRDAAIPGLQAVLDPEVFADVLNSVVPGFGAGVIRPDYVRYKPGTSCLAGFVVEHANSMTYAHAIAYARTRPVASADCAVDPALNLTVRCFPHDRKLPALGHVFEANRRSRFVQKLLPRLQAADVALVETLAYKPERRYVGLLAGENARFVLKLYGPGASAARSVHRDIAPKGPLRVARCVGRSRRHRALAFEWLAGERLASRVAAETADLDVIAGVANALGELHRQLRVAKISRVPQYGSFLMAAARSLGGLEPSYADRAVDLALAAACALQEQSTDVQPIHGDFYAEQVLLGDSGVAILDLDHAGWGDPVLDPGNFLAHLEYDVITGQIGSDTRDSIAEALIGGYECATARSIAARMPASVAVNLLRLATRPFRTRARNWDELTIALLDRAEALLQRHQRTRCAVAPDQIPSAALDLSFMSPRLAQLTSHDANDGRRIAGVRVVRHKPGRRALIEYDIACADGCRTTLLGKVRTKGIDERTFRVVDALSCAGFDERSADGISVPQPLGLLPEVRMWLQRKVPGRDDSLPSPGRVAEVINKLHRCDVAASRRHSGDDELAILRERLALLAASKPKLSDRVHALTSRCEALVAALQPAQTRGIHRDFHPGQLLVHGDRVYLLDLDLYAEGDPALDVGNFLAHVAEHSLRTSSDPTRTAAYEQALIERYLALAPEVSAVNISIYRTLSLARLVQISTTFPERRKSTHALLSFCERLILQSF